MGRHGDRYSAPLFSFVLMRIISGAWRGQPLRVPKGVRASTDRVREAIFSILGDARGLAVLDLYAGSGALGIEALSRGAVGAWFVDRSRSALGVIEANLTGRTTPGVSLVRQDSLEFLRRAKSSFDWIFCDPPYAGVDFGELMRAFSASSALGPDSLLILETDRYHRINLPPDLISIDQRKFGDTVIHFIRRADHSIQELHRA